MNVVLFDEESTWKNFLPLTFTRPVSEIRIGILTIKEKWDQSLQTECSYHSLHYLEKKFPLQPGNEFLLINSKCCPDENIVAAITALKADEALYRKELLIAINGKVEDLKDHASFRKIEYQKEVFTVEFPWEIFQKNGQAMIADLAFIKKKRVSQPLSSTVTVIGDRSQIFLEKGAKAEACILNTTTGPVYIGEDAEIMEGSAVRGPFALCAHSTLKLSTRVYGASTVGPHCKVGGELSNSVIFGYSNKAHDGFLGNSVIGEWCNLGADTNNSNLKNTYGNVKLYNYEQNKLIDTGLQFCGLIMGDHSKCGINTMFNTGTVVGIGCNIFGGGFPPTHIGDFSWGGSDGFERHYIDKFLETAERVYERRGMKLSENEREILVHVYEKSA
jgi:UDP-N-acetylglucosamine diphosphorylase/glucosamine-1-phosphate N-acetyltransferase